ncbi:hypothetical protein C8R47DRAFT_1225211 [Mycena vitilis]|nr:hypothetical protein C8R47DRAFT_1225211 [Mycena vitilis]
MTSVYNSGDDVLGRPHYASFSAASVSSAVEGAVVNPEIIMDMCRKAFRSGRAKTHFFPRFECFDISLFDDINTAWKESQTTLTLRLSSSATYPLIFELMPSGPHETAAAGLASLITETFGKSIGIESYKYFYSSGAERVELDSPYKRLKEAGASFAPANREDEQSVIIEVGRSETITELRGDMSNWFSKPHIKLVILIEISDPLSQAPNSPKLWVESWYRVNDPSQRIPTQLASTTENWTEGITGPLEIPIWTLLGLPSHQETPADLPTMLVIPVFGLEVLRRRIIHKWQK